MNWTDMQVMYCGNLVEVIDRRRAERIAELRQLMAEQTLDALLLLGRGLDGIAPWLTGLPGPDAPWRNDGGYLILPQGDVVEMTGNAVVNEAFRRSLRARDEMPMPCVEVAHLQRMPGLDVGLIEPRFGRVGITHTELLPQSHWAALDARLPGARLVDETEAVRALCSLRTPEDVEAARAAANSHDRVFAALPYMLRKHRLEKDVAAEIRARFYDLGGGGQDVVHTVRLSLVSGPDGQPARDEPILYPGRALGEGDRVDVSAQALCCSLWYSALGRSFVLGTACDSTKRAWAAAVRAQRAAAEQLCPGRTLRQAAQAASAALREAGYRPDESCFLYGVGLSLGELPQLGHPSQDEPLRAGQTLVVAPSACDGTQRPICCMDAYLVTDGGGQRLNQLEQELVELRDF